ncbi:MAG: lysophospholipid acyltransferase family protein [Thermoanaerobaculales bacterium]|jgi:1-acyl-sn-glycerol-3-phosphate acyltransferase|nr:lysophospholipid acyltransferase family protein [Thermoanaerobaculales bacterium]
MGTPQVPKLGGSTPQRGNALSAALGRCALRLSGWRFDGAIPDVPKGVVIVAPHTSNWDFPLGVAAMFALGLRVTFLGKHTLFGRALGPTMRWLGGIPVDRSAPSGVVGETVRLFNDREKMILALSPEGTRSNVKRWKTGFYRIAVDGGVPIIPVAFDWGARCIWLGQCFEPTGNVVVDLRALEAFYEGIHGRRRG